MRSIKRENSYIRKNPATGDLGTSRTVRVNFYDCNKILCRKNSKISEEVVIRPIKPQTTSSVGSYAEVNYPAYGRNFDTYRLPSPINQTPYQVNLHHGRS